MGSSHDPRPAAEAGDDLASVGSWLPDAEVEFPAADAFGVDKLIDQLADQLVTAKPPFAISLSGSWGVGKSTIAHELTKRLRKRDLRCIYLDTWTLDVRHLRRHLVVEIGAALRSDPRRDPTPKARRDFALQEIDNPAAAVSEQGAAKVELRTAAEVGEAIDNSLASMLNVAAGVIGLVVAGVVVDRAQAFFFGLAGVLALGWLTTYFVKITIPSRSRAPAAEDVVLASVFAKTVGPQPTGFRLPWQATKPAQIIVVVDNLDRLTGADALSALSQIRALLDVRDSQCIFLIPIDRQKLEDHLQRELKEPDAGADYLQKFFGLDVALTQPEPVDLRPWAGKEVRKLLPDAPEAESARLADIVVSAARRSPRAVSRLLNGAVTRHRIVSALKRDLTLEQAAFVESLLLLAPRSMPILEADPRAFTTLRSSFMEPDHEEQVRAVAEFLGERPINQPTDVEQETTPDLAFSPAVVNLHRFLVRHRALPLNWEDLRVALALRENRFWVGVSNWEPFQTAIDDGDEPGFSDALVNRTEDRKIIIDRSAQALLDSGASSFSIAHGLNVLAPHLEPMPARGNELRRAAREAVEGYPADLAILTPSAIDFLFTGDEAPGARMAEAIAAAVEQTANPEKPGLSQAAVRVRSRMSNQQVERIRKRMATWPRPMLEPVFSSDDGVQFVTGPVAGAMVERIAGWTPAASDHGEVIADAKALTSAREHGWEEAAAFDRLASALGPQANAVVAEATAHPVAETIIGLLSGAQPSTAIDQLGEAFGQEWAGGDAYFHWALRLPLSDATVRAVIQRFDQWAAKTQLEVVEGVLNEHRARLDDAGGSYRSILLERWRAKGHALAARMAMADDPKGGDALVSQWQAVPPDLSIQRAHAALDVLHELDDKASSIALAKGLEAKAPTWAANLPEIETLVVSMNSKGITRGALVDGLIERAKHASTPAELDQLCHALDPVIDSFGADQRRRLADELANGLNRLGVESPESVSIALRRTSGTAPREDVAVKLVQAAKNLPSTLTALDEVRDLATKTWRVRAALIHRATLETDPANVTADLEEAKRWRKPPKDEASTVNDELAALETGHPDLAELARSLRT